MDKQSQEAKIAANRAKEQKMKALKPKAKLLGGGIAIGIVATLIIGFSTDNLVTPSNADPRRDRHLLLVQPVQSRARLWLREVPHSDYLLENSRPGEGRRVVRRSGGIGNR